MKKSMLILVVVTVAVIGLMTAGQAMATVFVQDTWLDDTRDDPAAPVYSEVGVDSDLDGDVESAWFKGGTGTFDPVGPGGPLRLDNGGSTSSSSLTSYFTPEGSELTLNSAGDSIRVTWQFQVSGQIQENTSHGLRIAIVDSPAASRVTDDASPGSASYTGYALFVNMYTTLTRSDPIELYERADPVGGGNLLSSSSAWTALADDGTQDNIGYLPGTDYTFIMELTRRADGDLDIMTSMAGGSLDNDGLMLINYTGAPNGGSYAFDTFQFRPDGIDKAYEIFDTSLFMVEFVPEPTTLMLLGLGGLALRLKRSR